MHPTATGVRGPALQPAPSSPTRSVSCAESFLTPSLSDSIPCEQRSEPEQQCEQHDQRSPMHQIQSQLHQQRHEPQQRQQEYNFKSHPQVQARARHEQHEAYQELQQRHREPQYRKEQAQIGSNGNGLQHQDGPQVHHPRETKALDGEAGGTRVKSDVQPYPAQAVGHVHLIAPGDGERSLQVSSDGGTVEAPGTGIVVGHDGEHDVYQDKTPGSSRQVLSHTKMCRDRLNSMFERLRDTLPPPPPGTDIKHKAQVLDYACAVLKDMVERTAMLEAELALSSMRSTNAWTTRTVNEAPSFVSAASKVMSLFCLHREWTLAELWLSSEGPHCVSAAGLATPQVPMNMESCSMANHSTPFNAGAGQIKAGSQVQHEVSQPATLCSAGSRVHAAGPSGRLDTSSLCLGSCLFRDPAFVARDVGMATFVATARSHRCSPDEGIIGRAWTSMRPEWVTDIGNPEVFPRANAARRAGLQTCFALPITVSGRVEGVVVFYDNTNRAQDNTCLEVAMRLTWALGNAVSAKRNTMLQQGPGGHAPSSC
jgi:GAF domain